MNNKQNDASKVQTEVISALFNTTTNQMITKLVIAYGLKQKKHKK